MDDRLERELRVSGRAARAEVEAGLDVDAALARVRAAGASDLTAAPTIGSTRQATAWLAAAAAAAIAVTGGVLLLGSDDDDSIEIADPASTVVGTDLAGVATTLATTAATTSVPASDPPASDPTTTVADTAGTGEPVVRPGTIDLGPDDVIARSVDGDVWWYPGALSGTAEERILLIDRDDPRRGAGEGGGPNSIDHVAGTFDGSLIYGDCCEPVSGNLFAIARPGAEADLWTAPTGDGAVAKIWGIGYAPRLEPDGTRVVALNWDFLGVTDLATGATESIMTFDMGEVGGYEAAWAAGRVAALVWSFEDGLVLTVRDPADLTTELARVPLAPATEELPVAGIVGVTDRAVVVSIGDGTEDLVAVGIGTWTIGEWVPPFDVPVDALGLHLADGGDAMAWVVGEQGTVQRMGGDPILVDDGLAEVWIPEVRGAVGGPTPSALPDGTNAPTTILPTSSPSNTAVDWRTLPHEFSGIDECESGFPFCTWLRHDADGTPISVNPDTRTLTRHGVPPVSVILPESYGSSPFLVAAGPDDVVYLQVDPAVPSELAADLVAVTLAEGDAGREIGRWDDVVNAVGDSELVPTPDGLVNVDCCGPDTIRPDPTAPIDVPWLDRAGSEVLSPYPSVRVVLDGSSVTVQRTNDVVAGITEWTFEPAGEPFVRGMPQAVPTFDGGFVAAFPGTGIAIVRGWPNGDVEQLLLAPDDTTPGVALDRDGRALVDDSGRIVRVEVFADRTQRPAGRPDVDTETGTLTLPDLSGVDASWRSDPVAFAAAVGEAPEVNEIRSIEALRTSDVEWVVTDTVSNLFDDSVSAVRHELKLRQGADGRFSFTAGTSAQACRPGRGHQDFDTAPCT